MTKRLKLTIIISILLLVVFIIGTTTVYILKYFTTDVALRNLQISTDGSIIEKYDELINQSNVFRKFMQVQAVILAFTVMLAIVLAQSISFPIKGLLEKAKKSSATSSNLGTLKRKDREDLALDELSEHLTEVNLKFKSKYEEALSEKKEIEKILINMADGVISFNLQGQITQINLAATKFLEVEANDTFAEIFGKYGLDLDIEKIIYMKDWANQNTKININDKSYNIFFAPILKDDGEKAGITTVIQDVTEHVNLNLMRKRFVADVSHELKTPITSIMGYSETLLDEEIDPEMRKKFINRMIVESHRMSDLVQDLLTLSKYDSAEVTTNKQEFDLPDLVKICVDRFNLEAEKKRIRLENFVTADVPLVFADREGIEKVIINILSNAIKYTSEDGHISVYVGFVYNDAYVKVKDNGIGIKPEDIERIFDRFYRVDNSRVREKGGTGLGLSIAKEILTQNSGQIDVKSEFGKGTEIVIRIPTKKN